MKTKVNTFVGKTCWHEEWVIGEVVGTIQRDIAAREQAGVPEPVKSPLTQDNEEERIHVHVEDESEGEDDVAVR